MSMMKPRKTKYNKQFKGRIKGLSKKGSDVSFGMYGLKALAPARIKSEQIEAVRRVIARNIKKIGKVWIRIFPDVPVTKKPAEVRQGRGKGAVEYWACKVKPGRVMFEIDGVSYEEAKRIFEKASMKLPIHTSVVTKISPLIVKDFVRE